MATKIVSLLKQQESSIGFDSYYEVMAVSPMKKLLRIFGGYFYLYGIEAVKVEIMKVNLRLIKE